MNPLPLPLQHWAEQALVPPTGRCPRKWQQQRAASLVNGSTNGPLPSSMAAPTETTPFSPPLPPISSALPLSQLPISTVRMGQLRPRPAFVATARPRQGPGRGYPAAWNSSAFMTQVAGEPKPNETNKQRIHNVYKQSFGHKQREAGPSQPVDRAEINTRIKGAPTHSTPTFKTPTLPSSKSVSPPSAPQPLS